jgi:hypothetical protein
MNRGACLLGGFQPDDRILFAVVWAILGAIWLADRAARRFLGERASSR